MALFSKYELENQLKNYLATTNPVFFYWKGRVALYAILRAMNVQPGDEVILPAYTCVVVPNAIIYLGAKPVYVDINLATYNLDVTLLEKAISPKTKAIICQNTYGLSTDLEEIIAIAKQHNLYTIEDCTHGFGGMYNGRPNGSYCDAAFYSTQWNKPFSTGLGGFAVVNNSMLIPAMYTQEASKVQPSFKDRFSLALLLWVYRHLLKDFTYWFAVKVYRFLSKYNLILGSSQGSELADLSLPEDYFKDFSQVQVKAGLLALEKLDDLLALRKKNALVYTDFLVKHGKTSVDPQYFANHAFLKYPLLVKKRAKFLDLAQKHKLKLGDWFISPLHPVEGKFEQWYFKPNLYPNAIKIAAKMVNLPTDVADNQKVLDFLSRYLDYIE